ncbi:MAG: NCS2 family permease, partial [Candidatus Eremiobacterota bacterium]
GDPPDPEASGMIQVLERVFQLAARGTNPRTEVLAGVTTFITMSYILFVNPNILGDPVLGAQAMDKQAVLMATALACAFGSLAMGLYANLPFALAPGMGMNALFAYTAVLHLGLTWQAALGAVFLDGCLFMLLSLFPIRERLFREIPFNIKVATSVGIGLFITFIGLRNAGIVVNFEATSVKMGDLTSPGVLVAVFGLVLTAWLLARKVKGALLLGILASTGLALLTGVAKYPGGSLVSLPDWQVLGKVFLKLDLTSAWDKGMLFIVFTFTFVSVFDTAGTLVGLTTKLGWIDRENQTFPALPKALVADAGAIMFGAVAGTSTTTTYIESATGVAEGGRTGLTAVTCAALFLATLVLAPLAGLIPAQATAPILILVGYFMLEPVVELRLDDITEALPAFLTMIMMPFTYSIAHGLIWGILCYVALKVLTGRWREVQVTTWVLAVLFLISIVYHP